jgi:transposase-like protein
VAERGVEVDASCIWRWVQAYAPELNKRCRPHLKPTNKSYRIDETYSALSSARFRRVQVPPALE